MDRPLCSRTGVAVRWVHAAAAAVLALGLAPRGACQAPWYHFVRRPAAFGAESAFDARCVHDLYTISRAITSAPGKTHLLLCDVTPDPQSGVRGAAPKLSQNGDNTAPPAVILGQAPPRTPGMQQEVEFGTYTVLAGLGCAPPFSRGTFQWEHRFEVIEWQFHYLNDLDPFDVPGVAVIQPPDMPQMLQHPKPTYSIPAEYVGILQDEQAFNRAHPSWTEAVAAEPGLAFAKAQLKSGNPLVVMEATRALSAAGKLDREAAAGLVKEGPGMWQALNAVAILCGMTKEGEASLGQAIVDAIDGAKNLEDLKALFIGATVAYSTAWDEQEKAVQVRPPMYVVSRTTPLPLNGTAPYLQAVFKHAVDRRHAMKARTPANQYMELLEGREKWAYDQALDHTMELASSPGQPEGSAAATGAPAAQNPAATAPVPADTGVTNPQQGTGGATTPAEDSTLPPLILSKEDQTRIDELGKMTGKPLTYDQKVAVVKALRDYRSMLKAARSVFDDHAAKVLSMTIDELHTRERKFRHDEAEQKKEQESAGTAAAP